jgi:electron transfer flavoprotein alpha/beta subunit
MKRTALSLAAGGILVCCGRATAQDPTLAISREVTAFTSVSASPAPATLAVSREVTAYTSQATSAPPATLAVSREITAFRYYSLRDIAAALRIAAGLRTATPVEVQWLNLATDAPSTSVLDILDAAAVAMKAAHPELVP